MTTRDLLELFAADPSLTADEAETPIEMVDDAGSSDPSVLAADLVQQNHAGPGEERLTFDEILRIYS